MTFKDIRALSGLSRSEFSRRYGIPVRTLESWEAAPEKGGRVPPDWALALLLRVVTEDAERPVMND